MSKTELNKKSKQAINYFDYVPDEILYKIISIPPPFDLCMLAMVSQRFQRVCGDKRLWKRLSLTDISSSQIEMLITSSFPIKELDLSCTNVRISDTRAVSSNSHMTLKKLNLTAQTNNDIIYVLERFRTKELILKWMPYCSYPNSGMIKAISKHENLEVLSMEWRAFDYVGVDDIQVLFNGSNRLRRLNLSGCHLSTVKLRALCDHISETVEKLVLLNATFHRPEEVRARRNRGNHEAYLEMESIAVAESFEVLFHRVKNLKYFVTPLGHFRISIARISQYQSLEILRLCGDEATLRSCEDHFRNPNFVRVLEEMAPRLRRIDIILRNGSWVHGERRARLHGSNLIQLEKLSEALIGFDVEVYDKKFECGIRLYIRKQRANIH